MAIRIFIRIIIIMVDVRNKKILFLSPKGSCLHYSEGIKNVLQKKGATVFFYDERPSQNSFAKVLIKKFKKSFPIYYLAYINRLIKQHPKVDVVFIIRGEGLTLASMNLLKQAYPKAKFILYMWDVLRAVDVSEVIPFFDLVLTFDPDDAIKMGGGVKFFPTFYLEEYRTLQKTSVDIDVFFVGSIYANRFRELHQIEKILLKDNVVPFFYYYLPSRLLYFKNYVLTNRELKAKYKDFYYSPMTFQETLSYMARSKAILDIRYSEQKSLSMRAFEALGSGTKYITNNPEIRKYDFYHSNNIYIIGYEDRSISDFLRLEYQKIPQGLIEKYSVFNWVDSIFRLVV